MATHLSPDFVSSVCNARGGNLTADRDRVDCKRCLDRITAANAVEADLWAMQAAQADVPVGNVRAFYHFALDRREAACQAARERLEYELNELAKTARRAEAAGVQR